MLLPLQVKALEVWRRARVVTRERVELMKHDERGIAADTVYTALMVAGAVIVATTIVAFLIAKANSIAGN